MSGSKPIRVMIVDDHGMVRAGLAAYLRSEAGLELVGEARDGQEAVDMCDQVQPDVILMDLVMPEMDGVAATEIIRQQWPQVQVIALTSFGEKKLVRGALQAGALAPANWQLVVAPNRRTGAAPVQAAGLHVTGNTVVGVVFVGPPTIHYSASPPDLLDSLGNPLPPFTIPLNILP